ncbi:MAG: hypothetical protein ACK4X1_18425, partial [Terricaulis sp.]
TVLFSYSIFLSVRSLKQSRKERGEAAPGSDHSEAKDARPSQGLTQILREIVPLQLYFDYYRPSFHPWNTDDSALIEEWKRRYRDYAPIRDAAPAEA